MNSSIKKLPDSKVEILIEIPPQEFNDYYRKAVLDIGKNSEIKGFRKGHVPSNVLEKEIGQEKIFSQAAEKAIKEKYVQAIIDNNLEVVEKPEIEILKLTPGNPFVFKAKTTILPEIELPDYKKIASSVEKQKFSIGEKEIETIINHLQKSRAKLIALNEKAQKGNFIEIEYQSSSIEGGKKIKDAFTLGEGHLIEGFEGKLEEMKAGEEKTFSLMIPKNYFSKDLAGKEVEFKVKMNSVFEMELPKVDDRFAKSLGNFEDLISLKKNIKEGLEVEKEREMKEKLRQEILEKIIKSLKWEIPNILVEMERDRLFNDLKINLSQNSKISFEDYLNKIKKSEEEIKESLLGPAKNNVKIFLTLRAIAKKENIKVSEEEINQQINEILKNYSDFKTAERNLDLEKLKEYTKETIINEKVFQLLEKNSKVSS